jgi:hypothetical protein
VESGVSGSGDCGGKTKECFWWKVLQGIFKCTAAARSFFGGHLAEKKMAGYLSDGKIK